LSALLLGSAAAVTVGFSRLYLGVHWPTDVVGGFALALAWVSLVVLLMRRAQGAAPLRRSRHAVP
jgi:undecaprenyl-diphosphatase